MYIFLTGMPGSGKTRIGRALARRLHLPFFDLDHEIVKATGMEIPRIFAEYGEDYFRERERDTLRAVTSREKHFVLATGGGTPCFFDNMAFMNGKGVTVFLHVPLRDLYERLLAGGTFQRPLLKDKTPEALLKELQEKYNERRPFYKQAEIEVHSSYGVVEDRVSEIIRLLPG